MILPDRIVATVSHNDRGIEGAFVKLWIPMKSKNDYVLLFGPGNGAGQIEISREIILEEAQRERDLFLMDYSDLESSMTGKVLVRAVDLSAVDCAVKAYELYKSVTPYPPKHLDSLLAYGHKLVQLGKGHLKALIEASGQVIDTAATDV